MRLIDADALRKAVNDFYDNSFEGIVSSDLIKYAQVVDDFIDNAPTIEERTKGKWEYITHHARRYRVCPCCHAERLNDKSTGWNFCPKCGADMIGEET